MNDCTGSRRPKVVLATSGTYGDLHPFISMALRLRDRGYEPVIATAGQYRAKVEGEGLPFHAVRPSDRDLWRDLGLDDAAITRQLMTRGFGRLEFVIRQLTLPYLRQSYDDMLAATDGASLIVTSSFAYAATIAAQRRSLPYVHVVLQPIMFASVDDPPAMLSFPGSGDCARSSRRH